MVVKESEAWDGSLGSGKGWMEKIRFHGALQIYLLSYLLTYFHANPERLIGLVLAYSVVMEKGP